MGLTVVNSTFVLLLGICANVGLTFLNAPPSPIRKTLAVIINEDNNGKKIRLILVLTIFCNIIYGQRTPKEFGFLAKQTIVKGDTINFYIYGTEDSLKTRKPLFLYLEGSGSNPVFYSKNGEDGFSSIFLPYKEISRKYHFVVISKPGIKFHADLNEIVPKIYFEKLSLGYRVFLADNVIKNCIKLGFIDTKKIVVFGHSEGAQIAPKLAFTNKNITHLAAFSGDGLNQMYDFIIDIRKQYNKGELSKKEADIAIDSVYYYYYDILKYPNATNKFWQGHTYKRWSTTINNNPLDYLLKLNIPIYIVAGTADEAAPIENMDYIKISFIENKKSNLTYKYYWDYDHVYNELTTKNGEISHSSKRKEVIQELMKWLD